MSPSITSLIIGALLLAILLKSIFHLVFEFERAVVFTMGKLSGIKGPGLIVVIPLIQKLVKVDIRTVTMDVPPQDVITKDNVTIKVNAVIYYQVMDPALALTKIENYHYATGQLAQTTLRSICGQFELDELLSQRERLNDNLQGIIDKATDAWGVKVTLVETKDIDLPQEMQRAMAKQAEAERERRAKIIQAEGEFQAATKLTEAAKIMAEEPTTIQLRYLETLKTISSENSSTVIFPLPIDFLNAFVKKITTK